MAALKLFKKNRIINSQNKRVLPYAQLNVKPKITSALQNNDVPNPLSSGWQ